MSRAAVKRLLQGTPRLANLLRRAVNGSALVTIRYNRQGSTHRVTIDPSVVIKNCVFELEGSSHRLSIGPGCSFKNVRFRLQGEGHNLAIGAGVHFFSGGCVWMEDSGGVIEIGAGCTFVETHLAVTGKNTRIEIGPGSLFAYDIDVRTGDSHAVVDLSGRKLNDERDIVLGERVWVASHCSILKGARLGPGSVVATRSTVTRAFDRSNLLVGGSPARALKEGISWTHDRFPRNGCSTSC